VRVYTNESPGSDRGLRGRWVAFGRSGRLLQEVGRQSLEDGWTPAPTITQPRIAGASRPVFLRRGDRVWRVSEHPMGWLRTRVDLELW